MRTFISACIVLILFSAASIAAPERYLLDTDRSRVGFTYIFNGNAMDGTMPVAKADILIDLARLENSEVSVDLSADEARAGIFFATDAMRGSSVLDTRNHPLIHFESTRINGNTSGAKIEGALTVRGITHPVTLNAQLFRQRGTDIGERDRLSILLTGTLKRSAFGATGFPDLVEDDIALRIIVRMNRAS